MKSLKRRSQSVWALLAVVLMLAGTDAGAAQLKATHQVVSSAVDANGDFSVTLQFTVSNPTGTDLGNINLAYMSSPNLTVTDNPALTIASLNAGDTAVVNWTVNSLMPAALWGAGSLLTFSGQAVDGSGQTVPVNLFSSP